MGYADHRANKTTKATSTPAKSVQAKPSTPAPERCPSFMTLMNDEKIAMKSRPSWLNYFGSLFFGALCLISSINGCISVSQSGATDLPAGFMPLFCLGVIFIVLAIIRRSSVFYVVTTKRIVKKSGFISQSITEVWLNDIRGVNTSCGVMQRFFGLGNVVLATASAAIVIFGIHSYRELANKLNAYRNR